MRLQKLFIALVVCLVVGQATARDIALNPGHPERHVVVKGDTLWDISAAFLRDPWLWPEVWYANPQIANPHLIYPGDVISLVYVDGKPQLRLERGYSTVKLSPHIRYEPLDRAIPTIPMDAIRQFLTTPLIIEEGESDTLPYILESADEHLIAGAGDRVYIRGPLDENLSRYHVLRKGETLKDPATGEVLGHQAIYIGDGTVQRFGDPSTLKLTKSTREASPGDRIKAIDQAPLNVVFQPSEPEHAVEGRILSVLDGVSQIGQYQVVVINRGSRENMQVGHVLAVYQSGRTIRDTVSNKYSAKVTLPDERAGLVMIFRTFEKLSYGLIMKATRPIHLLDTVRNP